MSILHFGCQVLHPEKAHLTRESYTDVPNKALSTFFPHFFRRYGNSAVLREAINTVAEKYNITPDSFEEHHRMEVNSYIRQYIVSIMQSQRSRFKEPDEHLDYNIGSTLQPYRTDEAVQRLIDNALQNYDLNMRYFASLKREDFDAAICRFQTDYPEFSFIDDLRPYNDTAGAYVMILDQYKQLYMGITFSSLKKRIQTHWQKKQPLDRLIFGRIDNSILSINSFGALDTTRIMVAPVSSADADTALPILEEDITETKYLQKFLLNRVSGGLSDYYGIGTMPKSRSLR